MADKDKLTSNNILFHEVDRTLYEIMISQSDNASESAEDILARLIANDPVTRKGEYADG